MPEHALRAEADRRERLAVPGADDDRGHDEEAKDGRAGPDEPRKEVTVARRDAAQPAALHHARREEEVLEEREDQGAIDEGHEQPELGQSAGRSRITVGRHGVPWGPV